MISTPFPLIKTANILLKESGIQTCHLYQVAPRTSQTLGLGFVAPGRAGAWNNGFSENRKRRGLDMHI